MDWNLQFTTVGFQGTAVPNALPKIYRDGYVTVGGYNSSGSNMPFGVVVSATTAAPNAFLLGNTSNVVRGVTLFNAAIAQNDPAKNSYYFAGQPLTAMLKGQMTIATWTKTSTGAIDPIIGCVVIYNTTTGIIEFQNTGWGGQVGWAALLADVIDVGNDLNTGTGIIGSGVGVTLSLRLI